MEQGSITVRTANTADATGIAAIWEPVIVSSNMTFNSIAKSEAEVAALITERLGAQHSFLVAVDAEIVGFATYGQFRGGIGYAHTMEHTIILNPESRGRGIGRMLMNALEDNARRSRVHSMIGGVSGANSPAVAFHKAIGYNEIARLPEVGFKFGRWLDLVLMQKIL